MRREDSLAQLPSEIIQISLQQSSSPAPAAPSGTAIKAKVLNALATVLKGRSTTSCGSEQWCQEAPPDTASTFIPLAMFQASLQRSVPAASVQTPGTLLVWQRLWVSHGSPASRSDHSRQCSPHGDGCQGSPRVQAGGYGRL